MAQGMISSNDARLGFRTATRRLLNPRGLFKLTKQQLKDQVILSQSYLRFEAPLDVTRTEYTFPIVITQQHSNGAPQSVWEQRLQLQDSFFITGILFALQCTDTGITGEETALDSSLFTFPSAGMYAFTSAPYLKGFWQAQMQLTVNNRVQCVGWDCFRHYYAPQAQLPVLSMAPGNYQLNDEQDGSQGGFYPVEPNWTLIGSKNNSLKITLPKSLGSGAFYNGSEFRAVILVRGVLAQNSTDVGN